MTCGRIKVHIAFWTPVRKAKTDRLLTAVGCAIHADHSAARQIGRDALQNRSRRNPAPGVSIQIKQAILGVLEHCISLIHIRRIGALNARRDIGDDPLMIFGTDRNRVGTVRDRALTQRDRILRGCLCALAKGGRILARCGGIAANSHGAIRAIKHSPAKIAAALTFITAVLTFITAVLIFITAVLAAATTATAALL